MESFKCPICGNSDSRYVGIRKGKPYCRKCITFRGQEAAGEYVQNDSGEYTLHYELSDDQKRLSNQLVENYKNGIDSLVHAVCGSGKTEIVMKVISYAIKNGERVGFSIPRKDVVIELADRFKNVYLNSRIVSVYGGHTSILEGNLVCLTTHQLFRYDNYFDLLIMDEIDAYPFKGNRVLEAICKRSVKGNLILMSATSDENDAKNLFKHEYKKYDLFSRYHGHPLPVPTIKKHNFMLLSICLLYEIKRFLKNNKQVFIFVPTIKICEKTYNFLKIFIKNGDYVHSKKNNRSKVIQLFREGKTNYLVTTSVLERGVTIKNVQVIILYSDNDIYDSATLIQISGRVGRKIDAPFGEVIYLASMITKSMTESIKIIKDSNNKLHMEKEEKEDHQV